MGFDSNGVKFLLHLQKNHVKLGKTITLGRQNFHLDKKDFIAILKKSSLHPDTIGHLAERLEYAEPLLLELGATEVKSIDASGYENADFIHDLNSPIPDLHKNQYDTVIDAGTLEHVFNFPVALKSCMEMLRPMGHFISIVCANNFSGHGFYQFSPELFFRVFSAENGFCIKKIYMVVYGNNNYWYEVPDPLDLKKRLLFQNTKQTYLFVMAQKIANSEIFMKFPQQSDYEFLAWQGKTHPQTRKFSGPQWFVSFLPLGLKQKIRNRLRLLDPAVWKMVLKDMGNGNKDEFKRIKID